MPRSARFALPMVADLTDARPLTITEPAQINREQWLQNAVRALVPLFAEQDITIPPVHVSCGFPKGNVRSVIGQCWSTSASEDGVAHVFISPFMGDSLRVLDILVHELIHAVDNCENGHKGAFLKMCRAMGLEGKATATVAGEALTASLTAIVEEIGGYPHAALVDGNGPVKKQGTRMVKIHCEDDDYTVRTTEKWLAVGMPVCPCGAEMVRATPLETPDGEE